MDIKKRFERDVKDHGLIIRHDDDVYRHITMKRPESNNMSYSLVTFPGRLVYSGDMGCFVFERLDDMFEFFRTDQERGPSMDYWHEKLIAVDRPDGSKEHSVSKFKENLIRWFEDADLSEEECEAVNEFIVDVVGTYDDEGYQAAYRAVSDFTLPDGSDFFTDFWETDDTEYTFRYQWACYAIPHAIKVYYELKRN